MKLWQQEQRFIIGWFGVESMLEYGDCGIGHYFVPRRGVGWQAGGLYRLGEDIIVLPQPATSSPWRESTLVHEAWHALQESRYAWLWSPAENRVADLDRALDHDRETPDAVDRLAMAWRRASWDEMRKMPRHEREPRALQQIWFRLRVSGAEETRQARRRLLQACWRRGWDEMLGRRKARRPKTMLDLLWVAASGQLGGRAAAKRCMSRGCPILRECVNCSPETLCKIQL